jgi:hypothetical protein
MKLCDLEGYKRLNDLLKASVTDSICPAICMTEGCDYTIGYCERVVAATRWCPRSCSPVSSREAGMWFRNDYHCPVCECEWSIFGLQNATMTVHSVAPVTSRHTRETI